MAFRSSITIVASPRPRVGKTLLARLLTDFHRSEGRLVAAFDLNAGERTLAQFLPEHTITASVRDINGQMALFDRLVAHDDVTKVIDLGHESFESFFAVAHQIGFVEEARRRSIAVAILFIVTPDQTSVGGLSQPARPLLARNAGARAQRNTWARAASRQISACAGGAGVVRIAGLAPGLRRYIETPPFSFADSKANAVGIPLGLAISSSALATPDLSGVSGTRSAHITGRFAVLHPVWLRNLISRGTGNDLGAFLWPDFPRACRAERQEEARDVDYAIYDRHRYRPLLWSWGDGHGIL